MIYNEVVLQMGTSLKRMNLVIAWETYRFYQQNKSQAARVLDISVRTLDKYLDEYELQLKEEANRLREAEIQATNFRLRQTGKIPPGTPTQVA
jgi:hypothetical protein